MSDDQFQLLKDFYSHMDRNLVHQIAPNTDRLYKLATQLNFLYLSAWGGLFIYRKEIVNYDLPKISCGLHVIVFLLIFLLLWESLELGKRTTVYLQAIHPSSPKYEATQDAKNKSEMAFQQAVHRIENITSIVIFGFLLTVVISTVGLLCTIQRI